MPTTTGRRRSSWARPARGALAPCGALARSLLRLAALLPLCEGGEDRDDDGDVLQHQGASRVSPERHVVVLVRLDQGRSSSSSSAGAEAISLVSL